MIYNATYYIADPAVLGSRLFDCFDEIQSYEGLSEGENAIGCRLTLGWGTMAMNFMPEQELPAHLNGLEGFIRQHILHSSDLIYLLARHRNIRMAIGCVIDTEEETETFLPFLFRFGASMNALTFLYDKIYDFTGDAVVSARDDD